MRASFTWALMATTCLSAIVLWTPRPQALLVPAVEHHTGTHPVIDGPRISINMLPVRLEPLDPPGAHRDIFAPILPRASEPTRMPRATRKTSPETIAPAPPPAPRADMPAVALRYLGTMVTPGGQRMVMLARGDTAVAVETGQRLDEGFVVQAIGPDLVRLAYPPTGGVVDIAIPPTDATSATPR
jgi:hypothetical protein